MMREYQSLTHDQLLNIITGDSTFAEWDVYVCYQTASKHRQHKHFRVTAQSVDEAKQLALEAYREKYPRRKQAWVKSVERVYAS